MCAAFSHRGAIRNGCYALVYLLLKFSNILVFCFLTWHLEGGHVSDLARQLVVSWPWSLHFFATSDVGSFARPETKLGSGSLDSVVVHLVMSRSRDCLVRAGHVGPHAATHGVGGCPNTLPDAWAVLQIVLARSRNIFLSVLIYEVCPCMHANFRTRKCGWNHVWSGAWYLLCTLIKQTRASLSADFPSSSPSFNLIIFWVVLPRRSLEFSGSLKRKVFASGISNFVGRFLMLCLPDIWRVFSRTRFKGFLFALGGESWHCPHWVRRQVLARKSLCGVVSRAWNVQSF